MKEYCIDGYVSSSTQMFKVVKYIKEKINKSRHCNFSKTRNGISFYLSKNGLTVMCIDVDSKHEMSVIENYFHVIFKRSKIPLLKEFTFGIWRKIQ